MSTTHSIPTSRALASAALLALTASPLAAQVPHGWAVASAFQLNGSGLGGLTFVHPVNPGQNLAVTGLPIDLTGPSPTGGPMGASAVLIDAATGTLVVSEITPRYDTVHLHVVTLATTTVASVQSYSLGVASNSACSVDQMAWLGQDVVFSLRGGAIGAGPFAGQFVGIFRPHLGPPGTPGTVVPVPTSAPTGTINALTVDPALGLAYFGSFAGGTTTHLYRVPVPGTGAFTPATLVASMPGVLSGLQFDGQDLLVCGWNNTTTWAPWLARIGLASTPPTVTPLPLGSVLSLNALCQDPVSGELLVLDDNFAQSSGVQLHRMTGGGSTPLGLWPGSGSGIAIAPSMIAYGPPQPGSLQYAWQVAPNPGGLPTIGNGTFALHLASTSGSAIGVLAYALGGANLPLPGLGFTLLLDPTSLVAGPTLPNAPQITVPFPLPASPVLAGFEVFAQAAFFGPAGIEATRGLRFSLH